MIQMCYWGILLTCIGVNTKNCASFLTSFTILASIILYFISKLTRGFIELWAYCQHLLKHPSQPFTLIVASTFFNAHLAFPIISSMPPSFLESALSLSFHLSYCIITPYLLNGPNSETHFTFSLRSDQINNCVDGGVRVCSSAQGKYGISYFINNYNNTRTLLKYINARTNEWMQNQLRPSKLLILGYSSLL